MGFVFDIITSKENKMTDEQKKQSLIKNLVYFRKLNGYTQMDIAEKLGYSNKNISKWENGEITPDIYILSRLAEIYNVGVDELLCGEHGVATSNAQKEREENAKLKRKVGVLSLLIFTFFVLIVACAVSIFFICTNYTSKFCYMPYVYAVTIILCGYYLYYRLKSVPASITLLACFIVSLFCSIFFTVNISPWLFLLAIPLFCFMFFYNSLINLLKHHKEKLDRKKEKNVENLTKNDEKTQK